MLILEWHFMHFEHLAYSWHIVFLMEIFYWIDKVIIRQQCSSFCIFTDIKQTATSGSSVTSAIPLCLVKLSVSIYTNCIYLPPNLCCCWWLLGVLLNSEMTRALFLTTYPPSLSFLHVIRTWCFKVSNTKNM